METKHFIRQRFVRQTSVTLSTKRALVLMRLISKVCYHLSLACFKIKPRFVYQLN